MPTPRSLVAASVVAEAEPAAGGAHVRCISRRKRSISCARMDDGRRDCLAWAAPAAAAPKLPSVQPAARPGVHARRRYIKRRCITLSPASTRHVRVLPRVTCACCHVLSTAYDECAGSTSPSYAPDRPAVFRCALRTLNCKGGAGAGRRRACGWLCALPVLVPVCAACPCHHDTFASPNLSLPHALLLFLPQRLPPPTVNSTPVLLLVFVPGPGLLRLLLV